jgi:diadenylate cyclase
MDFMNIINEIGFSGFLDITFMSIIVYSILVWFKRTRTVFVVIGMFMLGGAYLLARQLELSLTTTVFEGFFAVIIIAVVVIFQEEIKHFLEQLASRSMVRNPRSKKIMPIARKEVDILVRTLSALARDHVGAIVVLRGKDPIVRHLIGGTDLDGELSEP